ncbi:amidohydrolase [Malacoplasma penetrans]|uniref:Amidohydrolase 3 domain-containing protein n=1 Tax=Malacoplasma penetrans (strain HF-2) TaxID=272633 RepID=Q8EW98_MALP2|nr:amidohydrolase [Malacoplasma penetrans]RXY96789.1 amidohydrolase [Malacoplasma penetrans]BAC44098.1 conserved hypothetical protein [Malacoplasma penetrans HF-2]
MENITLFYNGKIYLGSKKFGYGFEIKNNCFNKIFISEQQIDFNKYKNKIDLNNQLVIPGLIDTHIHMLLAAKNKNNIDLSKSKNIDEIKEVINKKIFSENPKFIFCENLKYGLLLNKFELDKINDNIPIFIFKSDLHTAFVNTCGLKFLNIYEKNIESKVGGLIELGLDLLPNGILRESACQIIRNKLSAFNDFDLDLKNLKEISDELIKYGITNVLICDIFEGSDDYIYKLYDNLTNQEKTLRINHQIVFYDLEKLKVFLENHKNDEPNEFNKISDIKIFNDGSIGSKTAHISSCYLNDTNNCGIQNYSKNDLMNVFEIADAYKKQVAIHSIGDQSSKTCIEALKDKSNKNANRHKIVHFQLFDKCLMKEVINHKILLSVQPCFLESDLNILSDYLDSSFSLDSYKFNEINKLNDNLVSFSTDAPVCSFNPWLNIYYAITGNQINKSKREEWSFDIYEAIKCYTENGAYSMFEENTRGKIKKDYLADFIILNQDIFGLKNEKEILNTKVLHSYINGKKIF